MDIEIKGDSLVRTYPLGDSGEDGSEYSGIVSERPADLLKETGAYTLTDGSGRTYRTGIVLTGTGSGLSVAWKI